jgi:hypothetical protein
MAYPTLDAAYGFKPVNLVGGTSFAGSTRRIPIASTYDVAIFNGDLVKVVAAGNVERFTGTNSGSPVGVCMGVEYVNAQGQLEFAQYYPGTSVTNAFAVVMDNPNAVYKVAIVAAGTGLISEEDRTIVGANIELDQTLGGVTATGDSRQGIEAGSDNTTATFPIRVLDLVEDTKKSNGKYVEALVKINNHQYNNTTGV